MTFSRRSFVASLGAGLAMGRAARAKPLPQSDND